MARNISPIFKLQGTIGDRTFVKSKANDGEGYVRATRGTYKPAQCNGVLEENSKRTSVLNGAAKPVHDALKQLAGSFKQRNLWQQILSRMRRATATTHGQLYASLKGLEINDAYPLERLVQIPEVAVRSAQDVLLVRLNALMHSSYSKKQYCCALFVLWIDGERQHCAIASEATAWIEFKAPVAVHEFSFGIPEVARYYILCLKVETGSEAKVVESFGGMGMRILAVGDLEQR
jgi:hypothetical protein